MRESEDPPESFRLPDYADALAGLIAALGLGRLTCSDTRSAARSSSSCTAGIHLFRRH